MTKNITHVQLSLFCNENHLSKNSVVCFRNILFVFSMCRMFNLLIGSWKYLPVWSLYFWKFLYAFSPFCFAVKRSAHTSDAAAVPVEMLTRSEGSWPNGYVQLFWNRSTNDATSDSSLLIQERWMCQSSSLSVWCSPSRISIISMYIIKKAASCPLLWCKKCRYMVNISRILFHDSFCNTALWHVSWWRSHTTQHVSFSFQGHFFLMIYCNLFFKSIPC